MGRFRLSEPASDLIAGLGLILVVSAFVILTMTREPSPPQPSFVHRQKMEPFALVILDPGHGGQDSGAMAGNVSEKDLTFDIAERVDRLLGSQGIPTMRTRSGDSYVSLADRAKLINRADHAIVVSIHFNDGPLPEVSGIETYFAAQQSTGVPTIASWLPFLQKIGQARPSMESQTLARLIQDQLVAHTQAINRGTKAEQFYVLANVRHPAVLVEGGFLTNKSEIGKLAEANYREQLALAISDGILKYRDTINASSDNIDGTGP